MQQQARRLPLADLTARAGRELEALARMSISLQRALSGSGIDNSLAPQIIRELQSIDRISQSLADLGMFVGTLAEQIPPDLACDADPMFASLRLKELADALDPQHLVEIETRSSEGDVSWL